MCLRLTSLLCFAITSFMGCGHSGEPSFTMSPTTQVVTLLSKGQYLEARNSCNEIISADSSNELAYLLRAEAEEKLGNPAAALENYDRAATIQPHGKAANEIKRLLEVKERQDRSPMVANVRPKANTAPKSISNDAPHTSSERYPGTDTAKAKLATYSKADGSQNEVSFADPDLTLVDSDKAYRNKPETTANHVPNNASNRQLPKPSASDAAYRRLLRGIAEAEKQAQRQREAAKISDWRFDREPDWGESIPMDAPPQQIVRFDIGAWHYDTTTNGLPPSTTGRPAHELFAEPKRSRQARFVGQAIPSNQRPRTVGFRCMPNGIARAASADLSAMPPQSCADNLDNNGDGLSDADDPMCWADRTHPQTYSPELREVAGPQTIAPVARPSAILPPLTTPNLSP